jgi:hypothetical protein
MDEKLLILLGLGTIGYLAATNFNNNDDDESDDEQQYDDGLIRQNNVYANQPCQESYLPVYDNSPSHSVSYTNYPSAPITTEVSPLGFGQMVQNDIREDFVPSDYINLNEYTDNPYQIPVYNEDTGNVGLPVSDMTDMGADNKYIYDRTLGSIGFTSTKIGGRRRGQADYIRGDLPILPDRGAWFQVSADVVNTLLDGALGNQQALGSEAPSVEKYYEEREEDNEKPKKRKPKIGQAMRTIVDESGKDLGIGECDDEVPTVIDGKEYNYVDCIYKRFEENGKQPTMGVLKKMFALQQETQNSKLAGLSRSL